MRRLTFIATVFVCVGCASVSDPGGLGYGQYFQILENNQVVAERDTAQAGMINCQHFVRQIAQAHPTFTPYIRCSTQPTSESLPYVLRLQVRNPEQQDLVRHDPMLYRFASQALCQQFIPKPGQLNSVVGTPCTLGGKP